MFDFIIVFLFFRYFVILNELYVVFLVNVNIVVIEIFYEINLKLKVYKNFFYNFFRGRVDIRIFNCW